jgi:hypothetical protein
MDEADGRPGHVALQSGHLDAPVDAPNLSLCPPSFIPQNCHRERHEVESMDLLFAVAHLKLAPHRRTK